MFDHPRQALSYASLYSSGAEEGAIDSPPPSGGVRPTPHSFTNPVRGRHTAVSAEGSSGAQIDRVPGRDTYSRGRRRLSAAVFENSVLVDTACSSAEVVPESTNRPYEQIDKGADSLDIVGHAAEDRQRLPANVRVNTQPAGALPSEHTSADQSISDKSWRSSDLSRESDISWWESSGGVSGSRFASACGGGGHGGGGNGSELSGSRPFEVQWSGVPTRDTNATGGREGDRHVSGSHLDSARLTNRAHGMGRSRFGSCSPTGKASAPRATLAAEDQRNGWFSNWCESRPTLSWEDSEELANRTLAGVLYKSFQVRVVLGSGYKLFW